MTKRQNTNLSDASQSSTASYLNADSMAAQPPRSPRPSSHPSPRPSSRPMTRQGLGEVLAMDTGRTARGLFDRVDDNGDRGYEQVLAGMLTADDPDASSRASSPARPPSRDHSAAEASNATSTAKVSNAASTAKDASADDRARRPRGHKRLADEINGLKGTPGPSKEHANKRARFAVQFERIDGCFPQRGEDRDTSASVESDRRDEHGNGDIGDNDDDGENIYDNDEDDAAQGRHGSPGAAPKTPNGDSQGPH